jgi:hypothetical protein
MWANASFQRKNIIANPMQGACFLGFISRDIIVVISTLPWNPELRESTKVGILSGWRLLTIPSRRLPFGSYDTLNTLANLAY